MKGNVNKLWNCGCHELHASLWYLSVYSGTKVRSSQGDRSRQGTNKMKKKKRPASKWQKRKRRGSSKTHVADPVFPKILPPAQPESRTRHCMIPLAEWSAVRRSCKREGGRNGAAAWISLPFSPSSRLHSVGSVVVEPRGGEEYLNALCMLGQTWQRAVDEPATTDPHTRLSESSTQGTGTGPGARAVLLRGG
jgi:hypothetical protein